MRGRPVGNTTVDLNFLQLLVDEIVGVFLTLLRKERFINWVHNVFEVLTTLLDIIQICSLFLLRILSRGIDLVCWQGLVHQGHRLVSVVSLLILHFIRKGVGHCFILKHLAHGILFTIKSRLSVVQRITLLLDFFLFTVVLILHALELLLQFLKDSFLSRLQIRLRCFIGLFKHLSI